MSQAKKRLSRDRESFESRREVVFRNVAERNNAEQNIAERNIVEVTSPNKMSPKIDVCLMRHLKHY